MNRIIIISEIILGAALTAALAGCGKVDAKQDAADTAPPPAQVEADMDPSNFKVDHPDQFPLVEAGTRVGGTDLNVPGVIGPDVSRQVPVISTATGRVTEINTRVGDEVKQGQILFKVHSADISGAFADYRKAVAAEQLTQKQLNRQKILLDDGAIPASALEIAQTAEDTAKVDIDTAAAHLRVLGVDPDHPTDVISVTAPVSGVITDQQITNSSAVQAFQPSNASNTNQFSTGYPLTISDMAHVWIMCDVFENNLAQVHLGEYADVRLNAFPDRVYRARISNIGQILDPNLHTAKVRLEVENPGVMRLGMFGTATIHGDKMETRATVPTSAVLHLHDRNFVYVPAPDNHFRRVEVVEGVTLPNNMEEIVSGIKPGDKVVSNALVLQSTVEQ